MTLPPSAFADTWRGKPSEPQRVGLRLVGEDVIDEAQALALQEAEETATPLTEVAEQRTIWLDTFNTAVMRNVLAHAMCAPDDVARPWFVNAPYDSIRVALRPATLQRLWEELELLSVATSPTALEATDEEVAALGGVLGLPEVFAGIPDDETKRLRRLAAHLRAELLAALPSE